MRLMSGYAVFVGEYSELVEIRIVGIISYLLDIVAMAGGMYYASERATSNFADFISITLSIICGKDDILRCYLSNHDILPSCSFCRLYVSLFTGVEFVVFLCMCIATTFSLHEFEFKARWEELRRKRKALRAKKARKARDVAASGATAAAAEAGKAPKPPLPPPPPPPPAPAKK